MMCRYARTCPTYKYECKPSKGQQSTGALNTLNGNTTTVYYEPSAPIYFLIGNAGAAICPFKTSFIDTQTCLESTTPGGNAAIDTSLEEW